MSPPIFPFRHAHSRTRMYAWRATMPPSSSKRSQMPRHLKNSSNVLLPAHQRRVRFPSVEYRLGSNSTHLNSLLNKAHAQLSRRTRPRHRREPRAARERKPRSPLAAWGRRRRRREDDADTRKPRRWCAHLLIISASCIRLPTTMIKRYARRAEDGAL